MKSKALFLDRDGVINIEKDYVFRIKDFEFVPGIFDLCSKFQREGFKIFIITNQAGIARGYYTYQDFQNLTSWMINEFSHNGIQISKVYYCPHHPELSGPCSCRKPNPGMMFEASEEFNLDLSQSILIGDKISDIIAGKNAGLGLNILIPQNFIPPKLYQL